MKPRTRARLAQSASCEIPCEEASRQRTVAGVPFRGELWRRATQCRAPPDSASRPSTPGGSAMGNFLHAGAVICAVRSRTLWRRWGRLTWIAAMLRHRVPVFVLLIASITLSGPVSGVHAQTVFKCVDPEGGIAYQADPCRSGVHEKQIEIKPAPARSATTANASPSRARQARPLLSRPARRSAVVYSFECRTQSGVLFYRHSRCPASIDRSGAIGGRHSAAREAVSGQRIPRLEACHGLRSVGRDGREFDEVPTTYDRNLGRDPCRKY